MSVYEHSNDNQSQTVSYKLAEQNAYGSSRLGMRNADKELIAPIQHTNHYSHVLGKKQYELSNHLGNVLTVITDKKQAVESTTTTGTVDYFVVEILSASDYSPFGVLLQNRNFTSEKYRYGFNGQEKDDEVAGSGNSYTAEYWQYDSRLGRRWNLDPKRVTGISEYSCFLNNPIYFADPNGDEVDTKMDGKLRKQLGISKKEAKNYTPEMIKRMFAEEYGIGVEMRKGKLVYTGDVKTNKQVSEDARNMWIAELKEGYQSKHSLLLTFNNKNVDLGDNTRLTSERKGPTLTRLDLGDFESSDFRVKGDDYHGVPIRAHNLARVAEHEVLTHGVLGLGDDYMQSKHPENWGSFNPESDPGNTVYYTKRFFEQMGLPYRLNYYGRAGREYKVGKQSFQMYQIRFSNGGAVITVTKIK
jgi:RHS repeat-associated protein